MLSGLREPSGREVKGRALWPRFQSAQRLLCPPGRLSRSPRLHPQGPCSACFILIRHLLPPGSLPPGPPRPAPSPSLKSFISSPETLISTHGPGDRIGQEEDAFPLLITGGSETLRGEGSCLTEPLNQPPTELRSKPQPPVREAQLTPGFLLAFEYPSASCVACHRAASPTLLLNRSVKEEASGSSLQASSSRF